MASLDINEIGKSVRKIVRTLLDMPENSVRKANQNAPAQDQDTPFATVLVTIAGPEGWDERGEFDEVSPSTNVVQYVQGQRRIVASVQFFRDQAYNSACRLESLLQTDYAIDLIAQAGLGLVKPGTARNVTLLVDSFWEERGSIDVEFYMVATESVSLATFGSVQLTVETSNSQTTEEIEL